MTKKSEVAHLELNGANYDLPVRHGSEGGRALDVTHLREETGCISLYTPPARDRWG